MAALTVASLVVAAATKSSKRYTAIGRDVPYEELTL